MKHNLCSSANAIALALEPKDRQQNHKQRKGDTQGSFLLLSTPQDLSPKPGRRPRTRAGRKLKNALKFNKAVVSRINQLCAKVHNKLLRELALRISFSPREKRAGQVKALLQLWLAARQGTGQELRAIVSTLQLPLEQKDLNGNAFSARALRANLPFIAAFAAAHANLRSAEWPEPLQPKTQFLKKLNLRPGALTRPNELGLISLPLMGSNGKVQEFLPQSVIDEFLANNRLFLAQDQAREQHHGKQAQIKMRSDRNSGASLYKPITEAERTLPPGALLKVLKKRNAEWMHCALFNNRYADELILKAPEPQGRQQPQRASQPNPELKEMAVGNGTLLTAAQEHDLFCRMNYLKCKTWRQVRKLDEASATAFDLNQITDWINKINEIKARLAGSNTGLVIKMVRKYFSHAPNWTELIGEGNVGLLRAIDKFNFTTGNKFSTYASRCVITACQRQLATNRRHSSKAFTPPEGMLETTPDPWTEEDGARHDAPIVHQRLWAAIKTLSEVERDVLQGRFPQDRETRRKTLEELGSEIGVSKERIRQIEQKALGKLRAVLSHSLGETFSGVVTQ